MQSYNSWRGHIQRSNSYQLLNYMDQLLEDTLLHHEYIEGLILDRSIASHGEGIILKRKIINNIINGNVDKANNNAK